MRPFLTDSYFDDILEFHAYITDLRRMIMFASACKTKRKESNGKKLKISLDNDFQLRKTAMLGLWGVQK